MIGLRDGSVPVCERDTRSRLAFRKNLYNTRRQMNWFYTTRDQTQAGPVDEATLEGLFRSGTITAETLVWREGLDGWQPYSVAFAPAAAAPVAAGGLARCSECGQSFPPDQLITLAGRSVCGACKPIAVQKMQEGVISFSAPVNPDELWQTVQQRGFNFTIGSVLGRSWKLVKSNFWPSVGVALLCYLIIMGAGQIPLLGLLAIFLVQPQMMAGLNWYFLKQFRGEPATLNDSFAGFKRGYGQQAIYMLFVSLVVVVLVIICAVPFALIVPAIASAQKQGTDPSAVSGLIFLLIIPAVLVVWYFVLCWLFTPLLILDKGLKARAAMKLSRRVVHMHFWKILGLLFVVGLLCGLSLLALIVGVIVMLPVAFAVVSRLYEDAFGEPQVG